MNPLTTCQNCGTPWANHGTVCPSIRDYAGPRYRAQAATRPPATVAVIYSLETKLQAELAFAHRRIDRLRALAGRLRYELTGRHDARRK